MSMLADIEDGVVARLTGLADTQTGLTDVRGVKIIKGWSGFLKTGVFVNVEAGQFTKQGQEVFTCALTVVVTVLFTSSKDEETRRKGIYPILEAVLAGLTGQKLGLGIAPLAPQRIRNVTDEDLAGEGLMAWELELGTAFQIRHMPDAETGDLLRIGLEYYLQDPQDDHTADAADVITLNP